MSGIARELRSAGNILNQDENAEPSEIKCYNVVAHNLRIDDIGVKPRAGTLNVE